MFATERKITAYSLHHSCHYPGNFTMSMENPTTSWEFSLLDLNSSNLRLLCFSVPHLQLALFPAKAVPHQDSSTLGLPSDYQLTTSQCFHASHIHIPAALSAGDLFSLAWQLPPLIHPHLQFPLTQSYCAQQLNFFLYRVCGLLLAGYY